MAVYRVMRESSAERHVATVALFNAVSAIVMAAVCAWALAGLPTSVDDSEAALRLGLAAVAAANGVLNVVFWIGLRRHSRAVRIAQLGAAAASLFIVPLGTIWGAYVLWAIGRAAARDLFVRNEHSAPREDGRPYYVAIIVTVTIGIGVVTATLTRAHEAWLAARVEAARRQEAFSREGLDRALRDLRDLDGVDAATEGRYRNVTQSSKPQVDAKP